MADQGFECQICSITIQMVQNLRRHYRNVHELSHEEITERTGGMKEPKKVCPQCNKSIIRADKHVCPKEQISPPQGQRATKKQNRGNVLPSTSGACAFPSASMRESPSSAMFELSLSGDQASTSSSRPSPSQTFERQAMIPEIISDFEAYVVQPTAGGNSKRTAELYSGYIRAFLKFIVQENGVDIARKVINVSSRGDYFPLPHPGDWIESAYPSEQANTSSRLGCFNAYIKFAEYLLYRMTKYINNFKDDQNEYNWRVNHIQNQKATVKNLNKSLANRSTVLKEGREEETSVLEGKEASVPYDVMKKITEDYIMCSERVELMSLLSANINNYTKSKHTFSPESLRNWLMLEYYIQAAGKRPDTVRNLTWKMLSYAREDEELFIVQVGPHKTDKTYGSMVILLPRTLRNLLVNYCCEVYPYFKRLQWKGAKSDEERKKHSQIQLEDLVFPTNTGEQMDRIGAIMKIWKSFVPESFGEWNPTPIDYRRFCATTYQSSENPLTRENAPLDMGHSQATARGVYEQKSKQNERRKGMKKEALPFDGAYDAASSTCATSEKAEEMMQKQREEAKQKKKESEEERAEETFRRTMKHKLLPSERKLLRTTFDPKNRDTLLAKDIDEALKINKEFATFFSDFKKRENISDQQAKVTIQNSYRASKRAENKGH